MPNLRALLSVLLFALFSMPAAAAADQEQQARDFVNGFTDKVLANITDGKPANEKIGVFRKIFDETVDLDAAGKFVLGTYYRQADKDQYKRFLGAFKETVTLTWASRFQEYDDQKIKIVRIRPSESQKDVFVEAEVVGSAPPAAGAPAQKPISFICRLRAKDDGFKVMDIIIEGVSMLTTYKAEYGGFLSKNDGSLETLVSTLEEKNGQLQKEINAMKTKEKNEPVDPARTLPLTVSGVPSDR